MTTIAEKKARSSMKLYKKVKRYRVDIIESERGWGQRIDDKKFFKTLKKAMKFVEDFNADNKEPTTPDWYMYATNPILVETYEPA